MSIFPYVYYMVSSFHITSDDKKNAMYAGMVTSAFAFAEFSTGMLWGRLSDRVGRKPILLTGLGGTGLSMIVFGFSPNLTTALIARALGGLLNGNIGVLNTTVAEVVTVKEHQSRAFSIMPSVWCIGSIIGAGLGGTLADPVRNYPAYFAHDTIFARFPYLLPNLICCIVVIISMVVGILFLEETHEDKKHRRDIGLEIGDWILGFFHSETIAEKGGFMQEDFHLLVDGQFPDYSSTESSPMLSPVSVRATPSTSNAATRHLGMSGAFTNQVLLIIVSYGLLAYHTISAEQLLPVLMSLQKADTPPHLPFQFLGGFALSTKTIGFILSTQGFIQTIATLVVFPLISERFGSLATFRLSALSYPLLYIVVPYLTILPEYLQMPMLYAVVVWKVTAQAFAFPPLQILLANSAPSKRVLGTLNGSAASSASLCRAIGPTLSGFIQSAGLSVGSVGLPWWANCSVAIIGACLSLFITPPSTSNRAVVQMTDTESHRPYEVFLNSGDVEQVRECQLDCVKDADLVSEPLLLDKSHL